MQPEHRLHDQPQRPERAGEQLAEVITCDVLDHLAAGARHGAVGADHGDPDQQVPRRTVAQPPRARSPGREGPADGRAEPFRRCSVSPGRRCAPGCPARPGSPGGPVHRERGRRRVKGKLLPGPGQRRTEPGQAHPGLDADNQIPRGVLEHLIQRPGVHHQVALPGRCAPAELAAATARHHGQVMRGGRTQELACLRDGRRGGGEARHHPGDHVPWLRRTGGWAGRAQCLQDRVSAHGTPPGRRTAGLRRVA